MRWFDSRDENHGWSFVVAPGATSVKAPLLPAEAKDWAPRAEGDGGINAQYEPPHILFVEASILPSFTAFRREAGRIIPLSSDYDRETWAVLPTNGDLRTTQKLAILR